RGNHAGSSAARGTAARARSAISRARAPTLARGARRAYPAGMPRAATISRTTKETDIAVTWRLDEAGPTAIATGIGFLDHMPEAATLGTWATELIPEFFGGLTDHARLCLHLHQLAGRNSHHVVEAGFKAFARALRQAIRVTGSGIPSTKGALE